ncbi:MAG: hydroxymethylbilane synthase [Microthrixaceae bacterium]|nr:hydroxymethylbilane synthase [Microthrixaceae bacterium]
MNPLRLATRGSALARWQADHVAALLRDARPERGVEVVVVSTEGDRRSDVPLSEIGGKGVFVKEVQAAVLDGRADIAVHSAKDLPALTPDGLTIAAVPRRGDPRDALVGVPLAALPQGGRVATGSRRRGAQLLALRPDLEVRDLRGNIARRLAKADEHHAVIIAVAALERLGLDDRIAEVLSVDQMCPQVGQGALAVEALAGGEVAEMLAVLEDPWSRRCVEAERAFLVELGGDCDLPAGAHAEPDGDDLVLRAVLADDAGLRRLVLEGSDGVSLGREAAARLRGGEGGP